MQFWEVSLLASNAKIKVYYNFFNIAPKLNVICSYYSESSEKLRSNSFFLLCTFCFHEPIEIPSIIHNLVFLYSAEKFKIKLIVFSKVHSCKKLHSSLKCSTLKVDFSDCDKIPQINCFNSCS